MNPSAADIVEAIDAVPTETVLVLPNNSNVVLTAEQAAALSEKAVRVIPSKSVQAGFAAMSRFVPTSSPDENEQAMLEELEGAVTGEITVASRDANIDGVEIREGAYLGLVDDVAVVSGPDLETVVHEVVDRVLAGGQSLSHHSHGRGCASARRLADRTRGASSRPRGTRRPRRRPAALPAPRRRSVTEPAEPIRVLLVEDSEVYRDSLVFLLGTRADVDVVAAVGDGASAVEASREHEPDVVVLDYRLPDVDGATVASELSGPVVFLSASAGRDEYDAASSAGAALVRKDEGIDALLAAIRAAAGR